MKPDGYGLPMNHKVKATILCQYEANMSLYPQKKREVGAFLQGREDWFRLCLQYLYGHMPASDVLSFPVEMMADFVEATLRAWESIDYVKTIPAEIFFPYVLHHRVNSECLEDSRGVLMEKILPYVQGKTMMQAALAVNYWCYAHATYTPADDRTLGPLSVIRRTLGRCGEESVLAVAALRSVGIPARQCYCPRWSHCDDNHAWVEVWVDDDWHYMGACEPEPVLDRGWFTAAASRAMLVHTKQWATFGEEPVLRSTPIYQEVNCTARYADLRTLHVRILEQGKPLANVAVDFQIVNYSELFTLYKGYTDEKGVVSFETGLGDLCIFVCHNGKMLLRKVDMRIQKDVLELDLTQDMPDRIAMDLVPPIGRSDVTARPENQLHQDNLCACEAHREKTVAAFRLPEAAGNWPVLQAFLKDARYSAMEKEEILSTLRPKDYVDITCETLFDALDTAGSVRGQYPQDIFRDYILAPRIADEMLQPERAKIRSLFPDGFESPEAILVWMHNSMQTVPDYGINNYFPSAYGCLYYKQVPTFAFDMVFVALCRVFRFPARLAPETGEGQWLDDAGIWRSIRNPADMSNVTLTLENISGQQLHYSEHISIGRWDGSEFVTLRYPGLLVGENCALEVLPGLYRIITTTRQIDGTASVALHHLTVKQDTAIKLALPADQTAERLLQVPLVLPGGPVKDVLEELAGERGVLIFADPGSEPTEHLLQEMLECSQSFNCEGFPVRIFVDQEEALQNATLQQVNAKLHTVKTQLCCDPEGEAAMHRLMQVGDLRLPFVVSVDDQGRGVYASANYNIRTAQKHLRIQKLIKKTCE